MKKRSVAKSSAEQRNPLRLVLDETIAGKLIVEGLLKNDIPVIPVADITERGASDIEVLDALENNAEFYFLTRDQHFRYHPGVRQRMIEAGIGVFVITSAGNKSGHQIVEIIASAWKRMKRFAQKNKRPFVAKVTSEGKVEVHS